MKMKYGLILAAMLSTSVMAQVTNTPPPMPDTSVTPPAPPMPPDASTNKPPGRVKKAAKKKKAATKAAVEKKEKSAATNAVPAMPVAPFTANELAEAKQDHVNIRGQAHINSEVIGHLKKGEAVTVLEEVTLKHPKADEPAKWARIALPADMHVWVMSAFIDKSNQVVSVRKLNLRTGAGENYSVIGLLHKGDAIKLMNAKGGWTEIEAPTNAFAFVAAHLLKAKEAAPEPVAAPVPPPVPTVVGNQNTITPATTAPTPEAVPITASAVPLPPIPAPVAPAVSDEPLPKRIVDREGVVGGTFSIQAPTYYELKSLDNGRVMDYLYTTSTNVVLKNYKGMTIHVSGEEELDERWPNTPVITIQRIQVVK
jgi:uncharacterized protein YgiM (DUF1202 family)